MKPARKVDNKALQTLAEGVVNTKSDKNSSETCKEFIKHMVPTKRGEYHWLVGNARGWTREGPPVVDSNGDVVRQFGCAMGFISIKYIKASDKLVLVKAWSTDRADDTGTNQLTFQMWVTSGRSVTQIGYDMTSKVDPTGQYRTRGV